MRCFIRIIREGGNSLIVELPIKASGYIKLRKRDFLDRLLSQKKL